MLPVPPLRNLRKHMMWKHVERSKLDGHEGCGKVKEDVNGSDYPRNDRGERFPSPAAVFTFDQEEIHASKLLSFDKVGHDQNLCI